MLLSDINACFRFWHDQIGGRRDFEFDDGSLIVKGIRLPYYYSDIADLDVSFGKLITVTFSDDLCVGVTIAGKLSFCGKECGDVFPEDILENMRSSILAYRRANCVYTLGEIFQMRGYDDFPLQLAAYLDCLPSNRESTELLMAAYYKFGDLQLLIKLLTELISFLTEEESTRLIKHHRKKFSIPLF